MDGNPAFTVHATACAFRAAINLNSGLCCYDNVPDVKEIIWWIWCGNGFDVVLKVIMMIFTCGMFK